MLILERLTKRNCGQPFFLVFSFLNSQMNCYSNCNNSKEDSYMEVICCKDSCSANGYPEQGDSLDFESEWNTLF